MRPTPAKYLAGFAVAVLAGAAAQAAQPALTVKIGAAAPLTGGGAAYGKDVENGIRLALAEANAQNIEINGKHAHFVLDSKDDQGDPRVGMQVAQQLVDDGVVMVIGHFNSGVTLPASTLYAKYNIPMITPGSSNPEITLRGYRGVFRLVGNDRQNASAAGLWAVKDFKAKRISILDDRTAFGQGEADEFEKAVKAAGGQVVGREYTNDKAIDFSAQLTHLKSLDSDLVFFGGLDAQAGQVVKRMKQLGMKAQFVSGEGVEDKTFIDIAGDAADGAMVWEMGVPLDSTPRGKKFLAKFKKQYGTDVLAYAPNGYDAAWATIKAIQAAHSVDHAKVIAALKKTDMDGVVGKIRFDPHGDLEMATSTLYEVKNGAWVPIGHSK